MSIVFKIKAGTGGLWDVCRGTTPIVTELSLGSAIKVGRELGRAAHDSTSAVVLVAMICPDGMGMTMLARYAKSVTGQDARMLA
jgi:hypothetical protein